MILQRYIFWELFRAFVLTTIALTCMLGFGGGLKDALRSQGINAHEMIKLLVYLTPLFLTYSLPVAALFSTTITYGRLAADNEIDACRASGINVHSLLVPAFVLSIIVTVATFGLENYVIPDLAGRIERLIKRDIQTISYMKLKHQGEISHYGFSLRAERVGEKIMPAATDDGGWTPGQIVLSRVAFIRRESRSDQPMLYGTAASAQVIFDHRSEGLAVSVQLNHVRAYHKGQDIQIDALPLGPAWVPSLMKRRIKFLSLPDLRATAREPTGYPDVKDNVDRLQKLLRQTLAYQVIGDQLKGICRLEDFKHEYMYQISAGSGRHHPRDARIILESDVRIKQISRDGKEWTLFLADKAEIRARDQGDREVPLVTISFKDVRISYSSDADPELFDRKQDFELKNILAPAEVLDRAKRYPLEALLDDESEFDLDDLSIEFAQARGETSDKRERVVNKCIAEIHSRFAFSTSAMVLLVLGAGLGIIFRGGHFVSAFGLSFIPMTIVVVLIVTGKQISTAGVPELGVPVIYLGCVLVLAANVVILGFILRR